MDKKTYTSPRLITVIVEEANMIASSITATNIDGLGAGGNTSDNDVTEAGAKAEKTYSVWDEVWGNK